MSLKSRTICSKKFLWTAFCFIAIFFIVFFQIFRLGYSATDSLPWHLYLERIVAVKVKKDEIVSFTMPKGALKYERYYLPYDWYEPLSYYTKIVACVHPDVIETIGRKDYCDGKLIAVIPKQIKKWYNFGKETVPKGFFFAMGTNIASLDSRYFGFVSYKQVKAVDYPL